MTRSPKSIISTVRVSSKGVKELVLGMLANFRVVLAIRCIEAAEAPVGLREARWGFGDLRFRVDRVIRTIQQAKRYLRIVFGFTLLAIGVVMVVTPGPGTITILIALGVLAAEFVWARRLLDRLKRESARLRDSVFPPANRAA
jgi:tellurite resistance protein TerC